jgi:catechol 2,3-dioxygenase-like lactoylglutathione lyase family enzyme
VSLQRSMEINGIAHIMLTVSDFDACRPFYA